MAANSYWQGTSSNDWSSTFNWLGFTPPGPSDTAIFDTAGGFPPVRSGVNLDANRTVARVAIRGDTPVGPYTFTRTNGAVLTTSGVLDLGTTSSGAFTTTFNGFVANIGDTFTVFGQSTGSLTGGAQITSAANMQTQQSGVLNITASTFSTPEFTTFNQSQVNVLTGGTLTMTGGLSSNIRDSSKVTIGSGGTLNASGGVSVFGGELVLESGSAFTLSSGRTLSANGSTSKITLNRSFALNAGTTLNAAAGGDIVGNNYIDIGNGQAGTLSLDGAGTTLATAGATTSDWGYGTAGSFTGTLGNSASANLSLLRLGTNNATASLALNSSASLTVAGNFSMGGGTSVRNVATTINGGAFTVSGNATFDNRATVNLQTGTLQFAADATFNSGSTLNRTGGTLATNGIFLNINGGTYSRNGVNSELSNASALRLTAGGQSTGTGYFDIASGNIAGTLLVDGTGSLFTAAGISLSDWGRNLGRSATITLANSGQANLYQLRIGTINAGANVSIASNAVLSTADTLTVGGGTTVRTVAVDVNGGTLTTNGLATLDNQAVLTLSNGTVNFNNGATVLTGGTLNRTGGTLNIASGKNLDINGGTFNRNAANYELSNGAALRLLSGAQSTGANFFDIANTTAATGSLVIDGSGTLFTAGSLSDWGRGSGRSASVAISNGAQVDFNTATESLRFGTNNAASTVAVSGTAILKTDGTLTGGGGSTARTVALNVVGGTLTTAGLATFDNQAVVNLGTSATTGTINFNGGATLNTGSSLNWSSGSLKVASGKTLTVAGGTLTQTVNGIPQSANTTLAVTNGGTFTSANYFDIQTGTLNVSNAGSSVTVNGGEDTYWTYSSTDIATVNLTDGGVASYNGGLVTSFGKSNVAINSGGQLNALKLTASTGTATFNVNNPSTTTPAMSVTTASILGGITTIKLTGGRVDLGQLTMSGNAWIVPTAATNAGVVGAGSLAMSGGSKIDIASGRLELSGASAAVSTNLRTLIGTGYNGGDWLGNRVTSSAAAASGGSAGIYYGPSNALTVAKFALYGDADGDGGVSINDFNALAANFGQAAGKFWVDGDFDYDGGVSINDFNRLAANFGRVLGAPAAGPNYGALALWDFAVAHHAEADFIAVTGMPEPAGLAVLAAGGVVALRRRRR